MNERSESTAPPTGTPLREVLDDFLCMITEELDVERASLMLYDERTRELEIVASRGIEEIPAQGKRVPLGQSVSGFVFETGEPFLVTDARSDDRLGAPNYPHLAESFLSAPIALSVPIRSRRQILGVVNVTNRAHGEPLSPNDVAYLGSLASQLAGVIEGARRAEHWQRTYSTLATTRDQLALSERMRTVGQMAAGVVHDFNDALSVILARVQLASAQLAEPGPDLARVRSDLQTVIRTVMNAAETAKRLQDYTKVRRENAASPVHLHAVVREAVEAERGPANGLERPPVEFVLDLAEIPSICGNRFELVQVVRHLVANALEAMPAGGRLRARTWEEDGFVALEVRDTGAGMDANARERLFQPFFTTKPGHQGLGTCVAYGIVARHGGRIEVDSSPGAGTTLRLWFPCHDVDEEARRESWDEGSSAASPARVLFVDDDEMVRETYEEALRMGGHEVVGTISGLQALELCREREFDLVITDLSMSGMDGLELAIQLKRDRPELPVVLFSGFALDEDPRVVDAGIDRVLAKPCLIEELLDVVRHTMRELPARAPVRS